MTRSKKTNTGEKRTAHDRAARRESSRITSERLIERHLHTRPSREGPVWALDLRHRDFGGLRSMTLHDPADPAWPAGGRTTGDEEEAKSWVRARYATHVAKIVTALAEAKAKRPSHDGKRGLMTVRAACRSYIRHLVKVNGGESKAIVNRRSVIGKHILPKFGALTIAALDRDEVGTWLADLEVRGPGGVETEASAATKRYVRGCLQGVWRHVMGDARSPVDGIELADAKGKRIRREAVYRGDLQLLLNGGGAYEPAQVRHILAAAAWYDATKIAERPSTSAIAAPNTAAAMALMIGTGMRVDELTLLRWSCVDERRGVIWVLGTKTANAVRGIPLQDRVRPWLEELRRMARPAGAPDDWSPAPDDFVYVTRPGRVARRASTKTIGARFAEVLEFAGLKRPGKSTHWARATHATWGLSQPALVDLPALRYYLGHADAQGETTADYFQVLPVIMPASHRTYISHLPAPAEVAWPTSGFTPAPRPPWRERRRSWTPRDRESRERRRLAGQAHAERRWWEE